MSCGHFSEAAFAFTRNLGAPVVEDRGPLRSVGSVQSLIPIHETLSAFALTGLLAAPGGVVLAQRGGTEGFEPRRNFAACGSVLVRDRRGRPALRTCQARATSLVGDETSLPRCERRVVRPAS
jgi:hypothetical protein